MRHLKSVIAVVALLTAAGCSSDSVTDGRTLVGLVLSLTPSADTLFLGGLQGAGSTAKVAASATVRGDRVPLPGHVFETSDSMVATIVSASSGDSSATVTARGLGTTTVSVRVNDARSISTIVVLPIVKSVIVKALVVQALVGDTIVVTATTLGWAGDTVPGQTIVLSSSSPLATVTPTGRVTFAAPGTATISAKSGDAVASVALTALAREFVGGAAGTFSSGLDASCGVLPLGRTYCFGKAPLVGAAKDTSCFDDKPASGTGAGPLVSCTLVPIQIAGQLQLSSVTVGDSVACGVNAAGRAFCWGDNRYGQVGNGVATSGSAMLPSAVTGPLGSALTFTQISAGSAHACGLSTAGLAYCWGKDSSYQLGGGDNRIINSTTPIPVAGGTTFKAVAAGRGHSCALRVDGVVLCWGDNRDGQLGRGTSGDSSDVPTAISGPAFMQISARGNTTCGVTPNGSVFCWGANESGQAGATTANIVSRPNQIAGSGYTAVSVGGTDSIPKQGRRVAHSCALTAAGAVCWGANNYGQLGQGTVGVQPSGPVSVVGGRVFSTISAGTRTTCAVASDGAYCWGSAILGAMGNQVQALTISSPQKTAVPQ